MKLVAKNIYCCREQRFTQNGIRLHYQILVVMIEFRFLKRLSAGKNHHRATTKYNQNIIASANTNVQQIQACQNNSALTSEISSMTRILHRFNLSLASNRYLQTQRQATRGTILIGFRCLQRADRTPSNIFNCSISR